MKITGVNVVFVFVDDIDVSRAFYSDTLGLGKPLVDSPTWVEWKMGKGSNFAIHKALDTQLEGMVPGRSSVKFSFIVEGIRDAYYALFEKGVRVACEPRDGAGFVFFECQDPDGNVLQFKEFPKK